MAEIRELSLDDCKALAQLDSRIFSEPLSEKGFEREFYNKNAMTFVAKVENKMAGYINLWGVCGEVSLNNIAVAEEFRGQGIGKALMQTAFDKLSNYFGKCEIITLEVRKSNYTAISMYEKFGFKQAGLRKNFYRKPDEDAILMNKDLKGDIENDNQRNKQK